MKTSAFFKTAMAVGLFVVMGTAFAHTSATVAMNATVGNACELGTPVPGVMTPNLSNTEISSGNPGGSNGTFVLTCTNGTGSLTLNQLVGANANATALMGVADTYGSVLSNIGGTELAHVYVGQPSVLVANRPNGTYQVGAWVIKNTAIANGSYAFTVQVDVVAD